MTGHHVCEVAQTCIRRAAEPVEHPQRGRLLACAIHAREVRDLPAWRFEASCGGQLCEVQEQ